jgi:hypothetical protein
MKRKIGRVSCCLIIRDAKFLTLDYLNTAAGLELHQFKWLEDEKLIGALPLEWNWLFGEYEKYKILKYYTIHSTVPVLMSIEILIMRKSEMK